MNRGNPTARTFLLACITLLLSSCQTGFLIRIAIVGNVAHASFEEDNVIYDEKFEPCINNLKVYRIIPSAHPTEVWTISSSREPCTKLESVAIGVVPAGFSQQGTFQPLQSGGRYRVEAKEGSARWGSGEFSFP